MSREMDLGIRREMERGVIKMRNTKSDARGFTLIASLLLLLILSGVAIGLLMMVNTEGRASGNDQQNTLAYRAAEGAIEKMTSDLANTFSQIQAPIPSDITSLSALVPPPDPTGVVYVDYTLTPALNANGTLQTSYSQIKTGSYQGLSALTLPVTLKATTREPLGQEVSMLRTVEVALIPVFQFGVFSESDLGFFSSPNLDFQGRVHTNADLYLGVANGFTLTFHDKLTSYGNVVRKNLPNGLLAANFNDSGTVNILTTAQGCDNAQPACRPIGANEGSVTGAGGNPPASPYNSGPPAWKTISQTTYNGWIINGNYGNPINTGVRQLTLPFVNGAATTNPTNVLAQPFEIIRQPPAGEAATSSLGTSRLYNEAEIRVLLADDPAELPGGKNDPQNIRLSNGQYNAGPDYSKGVQAAVPAAMPVLGGGRSYMTYFAEGSTAIPDPATPASPSPGTWSSASVTVPPDWPNQPANPPAGAVTLVPNPGSVPASPLYSPMLSNATGAIPNAITVCRLTACKNNYPYYTAPVPANTSAWNLIDGYLRVEVLVNNNFVPVTSQWLQLGFARGVAPPAAPGTNPVNPNAILLLQQIADRDGDGVADKNGAPASSCGAVNCTNSAKPPEVQIDANTNQPYYGDSTQATSVSRYNWYPINLYDAREGEPRDNVLANNSCTPNGVMNTVELDVGNLRNWLLNDAVGKTVNFIDQNGYILYFSDRRGMLPSPNGTQVHPAGTKTGDSGLEDIVNAGNAAGNSDNALEPKPAGKNQSPEDVNNNGLLDQFGTVNIGEGFGFIGAQTVNTAVRNNALETFVRMNSCLNQARPNWVSGARHALKLVDGSLGNLPTKPDGTGGFTVGAENPVYILGNYNTSAADPMWANPVNGIEPAHAAAAILADAATVLSNNWTDFESFSDPTDASQRVAAAQTYYRVAISAGKNINFPFPAWENNTDYGFGTDGGVHNFLRYVESWNNKTLNYKGSLVSMYYSTYATGTFKCCAYSVYQPPTRNYIFDPLFSQPQNLPPGTPMFRDIDNLSYTQDFTPRGINDP
jgi:type II secretory pathway pseudopilin PulG